MDWRGQTSINGREENQIGSDERNGRHKISTELAEGLTGLKQDATEIVRCKARDEAERDGEELEDSSDEKVESTGVVA